jgi:hypothetical protein
MVAALSRLFLILPSKVYSIAMLEGNVLKIGDLVKAETISDGKLDRRIVEIKGDTVYICTEGEWLSAKKEHREPLCLGFHKRYVRLITAQAEYHGSVSNA